MIDLLLQPIQTPIEPKQQFLRIQKVNRLITMIMLLPIPAFEMLSQCLMSLCLFIVCLPVIYNHLFVFLQSACYCQMQFLHQDLEVCSLLFYLVCQEQTLVCELSLELLSVSVQFEAFDVYFSVVLQMGQFLVHLLLDPYHLFLLVFRIQVKLMIMPRYTELTANSLGAEFSNAYNFFRQVMYFAFIDHFHFITNISLITIYLKRLQGKELLMSQSQHASIKNLNIPKRFITRDGYIAKFFFILPITVTFLLYKMVFEMDLTRTCIYDLLHEILYPINRLAFNDTNNIIILIGQILLEGFALGVWIYWVVYGKSMDGWNPVGMFYLWRTIYLKFVQFPFPDGIVWRQPGLYSLFVLYDHTNDFYFSGHTGLAIILFQRVRVYKLPNWVKYLSYIMLIYTPLMLISLRVHYSIDVIGSILYVTLVRDFDKSLGIWRDKLWSFPYYLACRIKECLSPSQESNDNCLVEENYINK